MKPLQFAWYPIGKWYFANRPLNFVLVFCEIVFYIMTNYGNKKTTPILESCFPSLYQSQFNHKTVTCRSCHQCKLWPFGQPIQNLNILYIEPVVFTIYPQRLYLKKLFSLLISTMFNTLFILQFSWVQRPLKLYTI